MLKFGTGHAEPREASPQGTWLAAWLEDELNQLLKLSLAWDGHRASQITMEAVINAAYFFHAISDQSSILPQFFPLPDGGVQFEWHVGGAALEIEVDATGAAHALALTADGQVSFAADITLTDPDNLQSVRAIVRSLSDRVTKHRR
jgi:hypothetical protein